MPNTNVGTRKESRERPNPKEMAGRVSAPAFWKLEAAKRRKSLRRHIPNTTLSPLCDDASPCGLFICPICRFRTQKHCINKHRSLLERSEGGKAPKRGKQCFITAIAKFGVFSEKPPTGDEFIKVRDYFGRFLRRHAPNASFLCCLDLSKNTDVEGKVSWVVHVHGLALNFKKQDRARVAQALRQAGSPCTRPLVAKEAKHPVRQLAYCAKGQMSQRESIVRSGRANTRQRELSVKDEVRLALGLAKLKARQRFFHISLDQRK